MHRIITDGNYRAKARESNFPVVTALAVTSALIDWTGVGIRTA